MLLEKIDILNFKNITAATIELSPGVNCLLGSNGMGKSNLLEAVYFLCMSRPLRRMPEVALIRHKEDSLIVKGDFRMDADSHESVSCGIVRGKGKTLKRNGKEYQRMSEHIGRFPVVSVVPADSELVSGSADVRRHLMDTVISQADKTYLAQLIRYNRLLESRNKMLRAGVCDKLLYESIESGMAETSLFIYETRKNWIEEIRGNFKNYYSFISGDLERASISYKSILSECTPAEMFERNRARDQVLGYSSQGVHRDDISMGLGDYSIRRLGSQGQVKSYTVALKLAVYEYLKKGSGVTPILLLDDIFDKLDSQRVGRIMSLVSGEGTFGQIFITDTNREHLDETIASLKGESLMLRVEDGNFTIMES